MNTALIPLPLAYRDLASQVTHPGLYLDKFVGSYVLGKFSEVVQRPAIEQVVRLSNTPPLPPPEYDILFKRWQATIGGSGFTGKTAGPLTLHLARASALENAGICFHRIYGFVYLPGTGLKGLAHAFAETIWLEQFSGEEKKEHAKAIEAVFGTTKRSGSIVFHDAWPVTWPRLLTDILNSHHPKYYSEGKPPGDWEDPIPVYFLSVEPGTKFRFAVAKRRDDMPDELLALARQWLIGGLTQLGAGAKTASGYGDFTVDGHDVKPTNTEKRKHFSATLELVTPAFLAGAKQQAEDCDLRPSTLRGQLRWWWRTLHAGFVSVEDLRKMEAAIWGDTKTGGAVRVTVKPATAVQPLEYNRDQIIRSEKLPSTPDRKTSQGLTYHSYGMDEIKQGQRTRRFYLAPGTKWTVAITARGPLAAETIAQAKNALALLCQYGGVGAKCRKGFGSFADLANFDLAVIKTDAANFRNAFGITQAKFKPDLAESPSLEQLLSTPDIPSNGKNPWLALDQLAASAQQFAKRYKHQLPKKALGLPRRIGPPTSGQFRSGRYVKDRHASPVLYHFTRDAVGNLAARVTAFPAVELPTFVDSKNLLTELLKHLASDLPPRFSDNVAGKGMTTTRPVAASQRPSGPQLAPQQRVKAKIVADPKAKGRLFAEVLGIVGNILNPPSNRTLTVGDEVELIINSVNVTAKQIAFRWPA